MESESPPDKENNNVSGISEGPTPSLYNLPLQSSTKAKLRYYQSNGNILEGQTPTFEAKAIKKAIPNESRRSRTKTQLSLLQQSTVKSEGKVQCPDTLPVRLHAPDENSTAAISLNSTRQISVPKTSLVQKLLNELQLKRNLHMQRIEYFEGLKGQVENVMIIIKRFFSMFRNIRLTSK